MHHEPAALRALLIGSAAVWVALELRQSAHRRPEAADADRGSRFVLQACATGGVVGALVLAGAVPATAIHPQAVAGWIGLGLLWCGIALRLLSFRTLGRYFTFTVQTSDDQPVIAAGPYRVVRHPSYAAILLAVTGLGLVVGNWLSLVCMTGAVTAGLVYRITVEERALLRALGEPYRRYAATHKRLVPFVW